MSIWDVRSQALTAANLERNDCLTGHAVDLKPSAQSLVSKKRNISNIRRRLSAAFASELGDLGVRRPAHLLYKNPQLAGVYAIYELTISSCRTGWLE